MKMDNSKKKRFYNIMRIAAISLLMLFIFKGVALLVILIALSIGLSFFISNFPIRNIGIELVTFIAVFTGMKYGPWWSLLITFILITYHMVAGGFLGTYVLWVIPGYCIAAIVSGFMPAADISTLGIYVTFAINANNVFFTALTNSTYLMNYMQYVVTNLLFNFILFSIVARPLLLIVG